MEVMQFSKEEVREVLRLLAGILHLGNIEFITAGGAQVSFKTGKIALSFLGFFLIGNLDLKYLLSGLLHRGVSDPWNRELQNFVSDVNC